MEGRPDPPTLRGIIPNSFQHIFEFVAATSDSQFLVRASYLEIYNEEIRDLLSKDPKNSLEIKENVDSGVYVKDLTSFVVKNVAGTLLVNSVAKTMTIKTLFSFSFVEIDHVMQAGKKNRSVGETAMNKTSSRSHSIFTIVIEAAESSGEHIRVGKLNLVDLAGSERQSKVCVSLVLHVFRSECINSAHILSRFLHTRCADGRDRRSSEGSQQNQSFADGAR